MWKILALTPGGRSPIEVMRYEASLEACAKDRYSAGLLSAAVRSARGHENADHCDVFGSSL